MNIPEANKLNTNKYAATLYTDFAYDLPEGVTAYKVTSVTTLGDATLEALSGYRSRPDSRPADGNDSRRQLT